MSSGWVIAGRPSDATLARLLARNAASGLTYDHVGSTMSPEDWPDRPMYERSLLLGNGQKSFDAAIDGLRAWACHPGIRARVHPSTAAIEVGSNLLVVLPAGPFAIVVPDRVVAVVDTPRRFGFAYGTVEGHQERGEEAFVIEWLEDDTVQATVRVDAESATTLARLGAPVVRLFQHSAVTRYLGALRDDTHRRLAELQ